MALNAQKVAKPKPPRKVQKKANKKKEDRRKAEIKAYKDFRKKNLEIQDEATQKRMKKMARKSKKYRRNRKQPGHRKNQGLKKRR